MITQEKLIGKHPDHNCFISNWIICDDIPPTEKKRLRKLSENGFSKEKVYFEIGKWLLRHHVSTKKLERLERKRAILEKHDFHVHLKSNYPFPSNDSTRKGNCAEIILSEYLQQTSGLRPLIFRLHYNSNVDQAMKGDDCLLFNEENLSERIFVAEAKFRGSPSKNVVLEILKNLEGQKRLPVSIPFVANCLAEIGKDDLADQLEGLLTEINKGIIPIINVGFLLSSMSETTPSKDTYCTVDKHFESLNQNLIFVSFGIESPYSLVEGSFNCANDFYYDIPLNDIEETT